MDSRITIDLDFDNGNNPIIKIISSNESDDVRDKLLRTFLNNLGHASSWCRILYKGNNSKHTFWHIAPIEPKDLAMESELMLGGIKTEAPH